jgi:hypothetical protein
MSELPAREPQLWIDELEAKEVRILYPEEAIDPRELSPLETKPLDREIDDALDSRSDSLSKMGYRDIIRILTFWVNIHKHLVNC